MLVVDDATLDAQAASEATLGWTHSLMLVIPTRLGLRGLNQGYVSGLARLVRLPQSLGIIGGKPSHSIYVVGSQGKRLVYLDPHTVQDALEGSSASGEMTEADVRSCTLRSVKTMAAKELDPSLALAFYCRDADEYEDMCRRVTDAPQGELHILAVGKSVKQSHGGSVDAAPNLKSHSSSLEEEDDWGII